MKRLTVWAVLVFMATGLAVVGAPSEARAGGSADAVTVQVAGSPLGNITSAPLSVSPIFAQTTTDYVWRCQAGTNPIQLTLTAVSGGTIRVGASSGPTLTVKENLVENQALIVSAPDPRNPGGTPVQYWIRCLPHDFPQLSVTKPGTPPPGWYLTGNITSAVGSGTYAMVLDTSGTPVWYRKSSGPGVMNVTLLSDGALAWKDFPPGPGFGVDPKGAFEDYNLATQATTWLAAPVPPTDFHELHQMSNGDLMMLSSPLKPNVDLSVLGLSSSATIVDCVLQEVEPNGSLVWQWRASDHISASESAHPFGAQVRRQQIYDIYHCNSIDTDSASGNVLLSSRSTDAVYLIDKITGMIIWKLGGLSPNHDHAQILAITGDPEGVFHAQHDARFQPNRDVSLYDDQTWDARLAARGIEYHIDTAAGTATLVWSYQSPDRHNSAATGSFRRLNGGTDNVIGWGVKPNALFTEVDAAGSVMLNVTFPNGEPAYRVIKVGYAALDHRLLRTTAGLPPFVVTHVPALAFMGPASGPASGGDSVNITGTGFAGATAVRFGPNAATAFTVHSDSSITATVPAGAGTANVIVTGPGGTSSVTPINQLLDTASDASLESGTGSWSGNANATVGLATAHARSGAYSLRVSPKAAGAVSALTGQYPVPAGAQVRGSAWVLTPSGSDRVQALLTFYDSSGTALALERGPLTSSTSGWTEVSETAVAPAATASMAVGVGDESPTGPIYVDDASLAGPARYVYIPASIVAFVSPTRGPMSGGSTVRILGSGFTGAARVSFGSKAAPAFNVDDDSSITATAPAGTGTVNVTVTTSGGGSSAPADDILTQEDSELETGSGSWTSDVNSELTLTSLYGRTGVYSLQVSPKAAGAISVFARRYTVPAGAQATGSAWVLTPSGSDQVQALLTFYDSSGTALASERGPLTSSSSGDWTEVSETAVAPAGTASVALGVGDRSASGPMYIDDATLAGAPQYVYQPASTVAFVSPTRGPASGGSAVTILGSGFTAAARVSFGSKGAATFRVNSDRSITAIAPAGSGVVKVSVTTSGGESSEPAGNVLTPEDSDFESGTGSWRTNTNSSLGVSSLYAKTGVYSLQLSSKAAGAISAFSGPYAVPAAARVASSEWVLTSSGSDLVRAFIGFYDSNGTLISFHWGPVVATSRGSWIQVTDATVSPVGTAAARVGLDDISGSNPIYLDSASLSGSDQFTYRQPQPPPVVGFSGATSPVPSAAPTLGEVAPLPSSSASGTPIPTPAPQLPVPVTPAHPASGIGPPALLWLVTFAIVIALVAGGAISFRRKTGRA